MEVSPYKRTGNMDDCCREHDMVRLAVKDGVCGIRECSLFAISNRYR